MSDGFLWYRKLRDGFLRDQILLDKFLWNGVSLEFMCNRHLGSHLLAGAIPLCDFLEVLLMMSGVFLIGLGCGRSGGSLARYFGENCGLLGHLLVALDVESAKLGLQLLEQFQGI